MAKIVFVIGNGFDIDLGLKASYTDFANNDEWKVLVDNRKTRYTGRKVNDSLILFIEKARQKENWFNIEELIHNYIISHPKPTNAIVDIATADYEDMKSALKEYLIRITDNHVLDNNRKSCILLKRLAGAVIVTFNYTDSLKLCGINGNGLNVNYTYIHGNLNEGIVLGCDIYDNERVNRPLSFLYKYNMLHKTNDLVKSLRNSSDVIFFGHSVNEMDFGYFRDFFKMVCVPPQPYPKKHLTFITKDEKSMREIKDNIRNQGINVTDMYCNLESFDFILTDYVYDDKSEQANNWKKLLERINK